MTITELLNRSHEQPLVVDFWASWCEPCFMLEPILEELARDNEGRWKLMKIDIDKHTELATCLGIRSVPTTCIFYQGEERGRYNGLMWKKQFGEWIDAQMAAG